MSELPLDLTLVSHLIGITSKIIFKKLLKEKRKSPYWKAVFWFSLFIFLKFFLLCQLDFQRFMIEFHHLEFLIRESWTEHKKDTSFLTSLPGASEKLQIFNADLSDPESFNAPIEGCTGVFHVATPLDLKDREPEEIVTKRAISGALGILQACLNSKTVKRVVYTSSASAVVLNGEEADEMDESFWSDVDFVKALKLFGTGSGSYMISKTLTEKAVLEFGEKHGLDVVTIIPSFVVGPFICPKLPGSVRSALAMVFGTCSNSINLIKCVK
jgi:hypothetical protein